MIELTIRTTILSASYVKAPNRDDQNWWWLQLKNENESFRVLFPIERDRNTTRAFKDRLVPGAKIELVATPKGEHLVAVRLLELQAQRQQTFTFDDALPLAA